MKLLILVAALISQSVNNFIVVDNSVVWKKSYKTSLTFQQLASELNRSGILENSSIEGQSITGRINNIDADFKGAGFSEFKAPFITKTSSINGFVVIDFSEGEYVVTVKRIVFENKSDNALSRQGEKMSLETFALNKNGFKNTFTTSSIILDHTFNQLFSK